MAARAADKIKSMDSTELIKLSEGKLKYIHKDHKKVSAKMYDYNCNVKLKVDKEVFKAHRDVLSDASDYFSAMFSHNMVEKEQSIIELHEISSRGFTAMMEYFYHGHITVDEETIEDVLEAARFFHIEWLIHVCCDFLVRNLCMETYPTVLALADKYALGDFRLDIFNFIGANWRHLAEDDKLTPLSFQLFMLLLTENCYIDATEMEILETILKWTKHDPENRQRHLPSLLQFIRYPLMLPEELESLPEEIIAIPEIKELVQEGMEFNKDPTLQCVQTSDSTEARGAKETLVMFLGLEDAELLQYKVPQMRGFFSEEVDTSFMESVLEFASVAVLGNFVFAAGGYCRGSWWSSPATYLYNPRNRHWGQLMSMNRPRVSFSLCASENGIYAIAGIEHVVENGMDVERYLESVEFYNPLLGKWQFIPSLPFGCFNIAATFSNSMLFVSGGISDDPEENVPMGTLRAYNPTEEIWELKAPMLVERQQHSMSALNHKLYVFGGLISGENTMRFYDCTASEVYDIETNQWSQLRDTPSYYGRLRNSAAVLDDKVYVLGGKNAERFLAIYHPKDDRWEEGDYCGEHVQRIITISMAFPPDVVASEISELPMSSEESGKSLLDD